MRKGSFPLILILVLCWSAARAATPTPVAAPTQPATKILTCRIKTELHHDPTTSTQGLVFVGGQLFETSGGWNHSAVLRVDLDTGEVLRRTPLPGDLFAEGLASDGDTLSMLTWKSGVMFTLNRETLESTGSSPCLDGSGDYREGWGLAFDGTRFLRSDGTTTISFHRPETFAWLGEFMVTDQGQPVRLLNELEWVRGMLLANVWKQDRVAVIAPGSGRVVAWLDLSPLRRRLGPQAGTANGIAWNEATGRLYLTGKLWDKLFEIETDELFALPGFGTAAQQQP